MKVLSFNIWSDSPRNARWAARREIVASVLQRHQPDVAGLQEATLPMIRDLHERLPGYEWIGVGRDDGEEAGEFVPIFYRTDRVSLTGHGCFWLSQNFEKPGRGWDAAHSRVVTWARFADRAEEGRVFVHFNTHLDHLGRRARRHSARLLLEKIAAIGGTDPAVLTGDFNCRESSAPYRILTGTIPFAEQVRHPERSGAQRNAVEGSRGSTKGALLDTTGSLDSASLRSG